MKSPEFRGEYEVWFTNSEDIPFNKFETFDCLTAAEERLTELTRFSGCGTVSLKFPGKGVIVLVERNVVETSW